MLAWTIYLSFLGALLVANVPPQKARAARIVALLTALSGLVLGCLAAFGGRPGELVEIVRVPWIPSLGIEYHLAYDGISLVLVLLTGLAAVAGVLFSWNIEHRANEFFAFYLALIGGVYGVFLSFDLFLLFVFYEIAIIPKYFLIAIWGSTRKRYAAMKLALYSFAGSGMVLIGLVALFVAAGGTTMNLRELAGHPFARGLQMWAFPVTFVGFAILAGLWPFHTWAPTGHVAAPTAASMLLAGVVMKLGAYGCLRVAMSVFPAGMDAWGFSVAGLGSWREAFALLGIIGIVYGGTVALVQKDFKFVIGYSSVSHMGFVILGLMTLDRTGLSGAVLQMFSHGVIAGLLFAVVGRMVYDRAHTRQLPELQPMSLDRTLPFAAVTFAIASFASMGMPGFSGFVAELQVLAGAWRAFPVLAIVGGVGVLIAVAYSLRALQQAFFSGRSRDPGEADPSGERSGLARGSGGIPGSEPISIPERVGAAVLIAASLAIGLFPDLLLRFITPSLDSTLFQAFNLGGLP